MTRSKPAAFFKSRARALAVLVLAALLCSCMMKKPIAPKPIIPDVARLSALIKETEDPVSRSGLYEARARLQLKADNPQPDYSGALKDFNDCLASDPDRKNIADILDWIAVLKRLEAVEKKVASYESKNRKIRQQNLSLTERIAELEKEEKALKKSIEELQSLEVQMEQRRRQLR